MIRHTCSICDNRLYTSNMVKLELIDNNSKETKTQIVHIS